MFRTNGCGNMPALSTGTSVLLATECVLRRASRLPLWPNAIAWKTSSAQQPRASMLTFSFAMGVSVLGFKKQMEMMGRERSKAGRNSVKSYKDWFPRLQYLADPQRIKG